MNAPRWKYRSCMVFHGLSNMHVQDELDMHANDGWELCSALSGPEHYNYDFKQVGSWVTLIFCRPEREGDYAPVGGDPDPA